MLWGYWLRRRDSNPRPQGYEPCEIPSSPLRDVGAYAGSGGVCLHVRDCSALMLAHPCCWFAYRQNILGVWLLPLVRLFSTIPLFLSQAFHPRHLRHLFGLRSPGRIAVGTTRCFGCNRPPRFIFRCFSRFHDVKERCFGLVVPVGVRVCAPAGSDVTAYGATRGEGLATLWIGITLPFHSPR